MNIKIKGLLNSTYGVNKQNQKALKSNFKTVLYSMLSMGVPVIYIDTDSIITND